MKLITTIILFLITFVASANDCVVNDNCNYSSENNLKINSLLEKSQTIIHSSSSHNGHEFVIDIEEEEEDEKAKWLLAIIYVLFLNSSDYDVKTDSNSFYFSKNIIPTLPRYILHEVFRI